MRQRIACTPEVASQLEALGGLDVLWVGVRCDSAGAVKREAGRGNRVTGVATQQAGLAKPW